MMGESNDAPQLSDRTPANHWLWLAAIVAVAVVYRLWQLDTIPPGFHFDESFEGLEAWRILVDSTYRPIFLEGNFGVPPLNAYFNALTFGVASIFGVAPGPVAMRTTAAIVGVVGVLAIYGMAAELRLHDPRGRLGASFPLFAAATLAIVRWHVHFSRMGIEPIFVPLEWTLAIWLLLRGWRTGSFLSFAGCGGVVAATLYTYQGAWVIPIIVAMSGLLLALGSRGTLSGAEGRRRLTGLAVAAGVALVLAAPLLLYFVRNPELLLLRPSQISVAGSTDSPADNSVWASAWFTLRMYWPFGATGDMDPRRNLPGEPVLTLWLAFPFFAGLVLSFLRIRSTAYWVAIVGLVGLLSVGAMSEYAPHFHRVLGASAPTAILCAIGLDTCWHWRPQRAPYVRWLAPTLLVLAAVFSWRDYFVRWAALPDLYYAFDDGLWQVGQWVADRPADETVYLTPRSADHPTLAFARETRPGSHDAPISFDGRSVFPVLDESAVPESYVSIDAEDFRTPMLLPEVLPEATVSKQFHDRSGVTYATTYSRTSGTRSSRAPEYPLDGTVGDGIKLLGYDVYPAQPRVGETLYLQLHWLVDRAPMKDWTVYTHVMGPAVAGATLVAGTDGRPGGGSLTTDRWRAGWRVLDEYQIALPADMTPGEYLLTTGMYSGNGEHLPESGEDVQLGGIRVEAAP
jgi:hypothetical protein